jgi:hypothetical protein
MPGLALGPYSAVHSLEWRSTVGSVIRSIPLAASALALTSDIHTDLERDRRGHRRGARRGADLRDRLSAANVAV